MKTLSLTLFILGGVFSTLASDALAGSQSKFDYREPSVVGRFLPETLQAVAVAPTTLYAGITALSSNVTADGDFSYSLGCPACNQSTRIGFPTSQKSNLGFGLVLGLRNVTDFGFFMGGEVFVNPASKPMSGSSQRVLPEFQGLNISSTNTQSVTQTAQMGREIGGRLLAGYENAEFRIYGGIGAGSSTAQVSIEADGDSAEHSRNMVGVHFSAGVEYDIMPNISLRFEASSTRFGKLSYAPRSNTTHSVDFSRSNITLGLMLRN
jgi:opacity protein-like surface antigen